MAVINNVISENLEWLMPRITIIATALIGHLVALFPPILDLQSSHVTHLAVFQAPKEGTRESSPTFRE